MKDLNIKVKTALILIGTLLIGIVFGAMLHRAIFQGRVKEFLAMRTRQGFVRRFERAIDAAPDQKEKIKKMLHKYAGQFSEINEDHMKKVTSLFYSFREELAEVLTPEQMEKLRSQRFMRPGRFRRPLGFSGRPPQFPDPEKRRRFWKFREQQKRRDSQPPADKEKKPTQEKILPH